MKRITVKELMVPLEEYATVSKEATLFETISALERAQKEYDKLHYKHRAVLVFDKNNKIVGKVSQLDVLRCLEPKYGEMGDPAKLSRTGFSPEFLKSMLEQYALWDKPLEEVCSRAAGRKVKDFMYTLTEREYIEESAHMGEAIHQLVMGHHQSLLVVRDDKIVGILRLPDVFSEICERVKTCEL